MEKEEWNKFWKYVLFEADKRDEWWLCSWLEMEKNIMKIKSREKTEKWKCERCGKCCKFIVIPVSAPVDMETEAYLEAHGIAYDGKKLIIPAVCQYLDIINGTHIKYKCKIHNDKFANCRLGGEKECKEAQKAWALLNPKS